MTCGIVGFPQSEPSILTLFVGGVDFLNHHTFVRSDLESKQERKVIWGITFGSSWIATLNILADFRCYPFFPCETEWLAGRTWPKKKKSLMEWVKEKLDHDGFYRWKRSNTDTNWASVKIGENKLNVFVWNETIEWMMLMLVPILASVSSSEYLVTLITRLIYFPSPYSILMYIYSYSYFASVSAHVDHKVDILLLLLLFEMNWKCEVKNIIYFLPFSWRHAPRRAPSRLLLIL